MINSIEKYLSELKIEMKPCDIATRQDALNDAEDHLRSALAEAQENSSGISEEDALKEIIEEYGSPRETAESYKELDRRFSPTQERNFSKIKPESTAVKFFSIFRDSAAWSSVLYCLLSLATGVIYFTWAITGIAVSASMMILIIGIPIAVGFFLSFHGLAFLEGRIVEGLLGVRMPRRRRFFDAEMRWGDKVKRLLLRKDSWLFVVYFIIMLPLGIIYFTIAVTLFSVSLSLIVSPLLGFFWGTAWFDFGDVVYAVPYWTLPLFCVAGIVFLKITLHLFKNIGRFQAMLAKNMLVPQ